MTDTQTALLSAQSDQRLHHAILRLLHALEPFLQVQPLNPAVEMPDHGVVWVTTIDGGPERVILDALQANPALWMHALPSEVCIVQRRTLERWAGFSADAIDVLADEGDSIVAAHAARHLYEAEERERASRP